MENEEEFIWEDLHVTLHEEDLGAIKVAYAMPFTLPIEEDDHDLFESITDDSKVFKIENLTYDEEE